MAAAWRGRVEATRALLQMRADLGSKDEYGRTALMHAALSGQLQTARLLLSYGADPGQEDLTGEARTEIITAQKLLTCTVMTVGHLQGPVTWPPIPLDSTLGFSNMASICQAGCSASAGTGDLHAPHMLLLIPFTCMQSWRSVTTRPSSPGTHAMCGVKLRMSTTPSRVPKAIIMHSPACINTSSDDSTAVNQTSQLNNCVPASGLAARVGADHDPLSDKKKDSAWLFPE